MSLKLSRTLLSFHSFLQAISSWRQLLGRWRHLRRPDPLCPSFPSALSSWVSWLMRVWCCSSSDLAIYSFFFTDLGEDYELWPSSQVDLLDLVPSYNLLGRKSAAVRFGGEVRFLPRLRIQIWTKGPTFYGFVPCFALVRGYSTLEEFATVNPEGEEGLAKKEDGFGSGAWGFAF